MKKLILINVTIISLLFAAGCKKDFTENIYTQKNIKELHFVKKKQNNQLNKLEEAPVSINYFLVDGRIKFNTEEDFNTFVSYIEDEELESWISSIGLESYYNTNQQGKVTLDDDKISAVLNKYGVIEIDKYLIKMMPLSKTVLVMSKDNIANLHILESATDGSSIIQKFTFDDEVFGILEEQGGVNTNNNTTNEKSICRDRYARERVYNLWYPYTSLGEYFEYRMYVRYNRIGISVRLYSRYANYKGSLNGTIFGDSNIDTYKKTQESFFYTTYSYTPRCRSTISGIAIASVTNRKSYEYETYRSTRDCKNYSLTTKFSWRDSNGILHSGDPIFILSISDY